MPADLSRRKLLQAVAAGAVVLGFDPISRSWVTEAHAGGRGPKPPKGPPSPLDRIPRLDGELVVEASALAEAADDFGHLISRTPLAVLRPGSVKDISRIIQFAGAHGLKVAARGQGHSTYGQPQVSGGIVVDMRVFDSIHAIGPGGAEVGAGVVWSDLIRAGIEAGVSVPVTTDYIELTIGGTLAIGGIGAQSPKQGLQVDNVLELEVVTGRGDVKRCSPRKDAHLFRSVLGGLGQFGIITRAKLRTVAAPSHARFYVLDYQQLETFTADQKRLILDGRFDGVQGSVVADGSGGWTFQLEATKFFNAHRPPDDVRLLAGLSYDAGGATITDLPYFDWVNRLAPLIEMLESLGAWGLPHPWFDMFVPASKVNAYMRGVLSELTLADTGNGPVLLRPTLTRHQTGTFAQLPDEPVVFLFDILRFAPPVPSEVQRLLAQNRDFYDRAKRLGGKHYPMCAIELTQRDWRDHFGRDWRDFQDAKRRYDPRNLLTPGQGIF